MVTTITFTVAPANVGVYLFACCCINVPGKVFFCATTGATVTGIHSLVWFKYVSVVTHLLKFCFSLALMALMALMALGSCNKCNKCNKCKVYLIK